MKISKQRLKQIIKEELNALAEQTAGPDRWEQIFAGRISEMWWMAFNADSSHRKSTAAAVARKELENAIMDSGALKAVTELITSVEERLDNGEFDKDSSADTNQDGDVQWSELEGEQSDTTDAEPFAPATIADLNQFLRGIDAKMGQKQKQSALDRVNALIREEGLGIEGAIEEVLDELGI